MAVESRPAEPTAGQQQHEQGQQQHEQDQQQQQLEMEEPQRSRDEMGPPSRLLSSCASCCLPCFRPPQQLGSSNGINQILPANPEAPDQEFITFKPGRRIRVVIRRPRDPDLIRRSRRRRRSNASRSHSCGNSTTDAGCGTEEEVLTDDDDDDVSSENEDEGEEEDYWFENAAPNRLPVIQPPLQQPQHLQQSRIINKFEPQASTAAQQHQLSNTATAATKEDLISPGRLPRKNFIKEDRIKADDYEDEDVVTSSTDILGEELGMARSSPLLLANKGQNINVTDMKLEASESAAAIRRNSPVGISPRLRSTSPIGVSLQRSRSASPVSLRDRRSSLSRITISAKNNNHSPAVSSRSPSPSAEERNVDSLSSIKKYSATAASSSSTPPAKKSIFHPLSSVLHSPSSPRSANNSNKNSIPADQPETTAVQQNRTPETATPTPPPPMSTDSRATAAADDSCYPSPEIPHRTVCIEPEPDPDRRPPPDNLPAVVVSGSRLGGIANIGFNADEDEEQAASTTTHNDGKLGETNEALHSTNFTSETDGENTLDTGNDSTDAGYSRKNRNFEGFLQLSQQDENLRKLSLNTIATTEDGEGGGGGRRKGPRLPILFFLHGVGGSADIWAAQLSHFVSKGYTVIAPDMLGHGFSSCPDKVGAYTFTKLFKDVITIFDAYIPDDEKVVIICHSYGCSFGAALARTRPEKIMALIMIASGGPTPLAPPPNLSRYPRCMLHCIRLLLECRYKKSQQQQLKYNPRGKTIKFSEAFDVPNYVFKYIMLGQIWPEGDAGFHRRIGVPTLLVYGMRDTLVSLVEECEMERTIPRAYLELIPTAGHCVMLDTPGELNTMMQRFIKKWNTDIPLATTLI